VSMKAPKARRRPAVCAVPLILSNPNFDVY
jgi:hypothetical protein